MQDNRFVYVIEAGVLDIPRLQAEGLYPADERIAEGPVAVFECAQEIPCNPCETACPRGCIRIGEDIAAMPRLDGDCSGCALCVPSCPGLSIFILDGSYSETEATVTLPYELLPLPETGETVTALDRRGEPLGDATVVRVRAFKNDERCRAVTIAVPKALIHEARHFRRK